MITKDQLKDLLKKNESPVLEFKREWYWNDSTSPSEMSDKWGEFLKDIISLSNGYLGFVGVHRYLVIGFSESTQEIHDVGIKKIKSLNSIKAFRKTLIQKLEGYTQPAFISIDIEFVKLDEKEVLIFEIPSPGHITELKKELKTKTRVLDAGTVIIIAHALLHSTTGLNE
ncbi:MAG: ATP-binding protein [Methylococcales bacterium]|nr:ATP-binding protein [Methylococcales bacterium]